MSTSTDAHAAIDTKRPGIGMGRLVGVEWRKMTDTLGGRWLMAVTAGLVLLVAVIMVLMVAFGDEQFTASQYAQTLQFVLLLVVPVFCVLITTSEWSQRTNLATFTLEPRRSRVLVAKLWSVVLFSVATAALTVAIGAVANSLGSSVGGATTWNFGVDDLLWLLGIQIALNLSAFALGLLILNSAVTIAVFYVVAIMLRLIVYPIVMAFFGWARDLVPFVDIYYGASAAQNGVSFDGVELGDVQRFAGLVVSLLLWVALPGVLGWLRAIRSEVK